MKERKSIFSDLLWKIDVKIHGQMKCIEKFELKASSTTIYIHTEDEEGNAKHYKCPPTPINYKYIKRLFATDIFVPENLDCGNENLIIWKHQLEVSVSQSHTNTPLNKIKFNCSWISVILEERKITKFFWLPDGSPLPVRIHPVQNLTTVVVIPIPTRTAAFASLFVTLIVASRNLDTPILDRTQNRRLVGLLAYMKANLGTYTGESVIDLLHDTCKFYDLQFIQ